MKTGRAQIQIVAVFCPECNEAFYDEDDQDWSVMSRRRTTAYGPGRKVRCTSCNYDFRMPAIVARIGL